MKKLFTVFAVLVLTTSVFAQAPERMSYQAVIRNSSGALVINQSVGVKISILQGSPTGALIWTETCNPKPQTNSNGLLSIEIGASNALSIDWSSGGPYFLKTETDPTGGTNYTITGTSQLLSVPYALYAKASGTSPNAVTITGDQTIAGVKIFTNKIAVVQQGIGTTTPNSSAALEISSTTQGFLPPRMTQEQRDAITPVEGLIVYNTETKKPNYFDGAEWKNYDGTTALILTIGGSFRGGKVAYILKLGDPGYVEGQIHGLIAASSDQSTEAEWGCVGGPILGAWATQIGQGNQNTISIVTGCTTAGIAAKLCYDLTLNDYDDWYLPSKDELDKLYLNKAAIGGFVGDYYWSSTQYDSDRAWAQAFANGYKDYFTKNHYYFVRAVRAF